MISLRQGPVSAAEWNALTASCPALTLTQAWAYGNARAQGPWSVERVLLYEDDTVIGAAQAMIRRLALGLGGLCWISRGPLPIGDTALDSDTYMGMLTVLRRHFADERGFYLRIAPAWPDQEKRIATQDSPFSDAGPLGWHSGTLDLRVPEEQLRKGLAGKWRNPVNKAEALGMSATSDGGRDLIEEFCVAHDRFVAESGFATTVNGGLVRALSDANDPGLELRVFRASLENETAAWVLTARTGRRVEYLAGHTTPSGRRAGGGQFLLWRAILAAKAEGAEIFDVGGMDPILTPPGIYAFKQGTGAQPYALAPELEAMPRGPLQRCIAIGIRAAARRARADG